MQVYSLALPGCQNRSLDQLVTDIEAGIGSDGAITVFSDGVGDSTLYISLRSVPSETNLSLLASANRLAAETELTLEGFTNLSDAVYLGNFFTDVTVTCLNCSFVRQHGEEQKSHFPSSSRGPGSRGIKISRSRIDVACLKKVFERGFQNANGFLIHDTTISGEAPGLLVDAGSSDLKLVETTVLCHSPPEIRTSGVVVLDHCSIDQGMVQLLNAASEHTSLSIRNCHYKTKALRDVEHVSLHGIPNTKERSEQLAKIVQEVSTPEDFTP
ncbi:hypothetical protein [Planctomycetes bacterium CA13]